MQLGLLSRPSDRLGRFKAVRPQFNPLNVVPWVLDVVHKLPKVDRIDHCTSHTELQTAEVVMILKGLTTGPGIAPGED